jgi:hypothetical protein
MKCGSPATHFAVDDPYCERCWNKEMYGETPLTRFAGRVWRFALYLGLTLAGIYFLVAFVKWCWKHA